MIRVAILLFLLVFLHTDHALIPVDTRLVPKQTEQTTPKQTKSLAASQKERFKMVKTQIEYPRDGRNPVKSKAVLAAMRTVPRHLFVPKTLRDHAYGDSPLPIGFGQTISQPYIVALMSALASLEPGMRVLEIGTGSGYQAAVLSALHAQVYSIEIIRSLYLGAQKSLVEAGYKNVHLNHSDGYLGWPDAAPFDVILVTCAAGHIPPPLWDQLKPGGRMVIPIGGPYEVQRLVVANKLRDGSRTTKTITQVRFVPLTRSSDKR